MMNNIKILSFTLMSVITLSGCVAAKHIKPADVSGLTSPNEVIQTKNLNGKNGTGREYFTSEVVFDHQIPYTYLKTFCEVQSGKFLQVYKSRLSNLPSNDSAYGANIAMPYIGGFSCNSTKPWAVTIEPVSTRYNPTQHLSFMTMVTKVVPYSQLQSTTKYYDQVDQQKKIQLEYQKQENNRKILEDQKNYRKKLISNAPKPSDIGATICKDTDVSEYTGMLVFGQPQFRTVSGAKVIASLESFGNGNQNIKINIKGWLSDNGRIGSGNNVIYKQTPLESGRVIWDDKFGWYKCNY
ncbi:hypothetical protein [Acinetobacter baumannii]|uniref:hypothetical protein n=1 Tax=Acinetobacter baumannii TaxID=470 RepID=UPI001D17CF77|nr:hypothetical protein [Acinetobacter baumannii]